MLVAMLATSPVAAKNPSWYIEYTKLPIAVAAGNDAGYFVKVGNTGPSNINTLMLTVTPVATPTAAPSYFSGLTWNTGAHGSCTNTGPAGVGPLTCDLGTVVPGQYVTFRVAFNVPAGSTGTFDVDIAIQSGAGNTGSDPGSSRGDAKTVTAKTAINSSPNFDAGFVVDDLLYETTGSLGRGNKQNSSALVADTLLTVTVEDGSGVVAPTCDVAGCSGAFGEWTYLDIPGNTNLIKATLNIWGGSVPGGASADAIYLIHVLDDGTVDLIGDDGSRCTPTTGTPTNADCITVTKIGSNFRIVAWLHGNGNLRGGY
jgi:hypothetical protein